MGEVGTITLSLETFIDVLCDVSRSIWANGFHRLILLNGHGGNEQPTWAAAVKLAEEDIWPVALTYWNMATDELLAWSEADQGSIGHGGEWETSLQLYLRPELVDSSRAVKDDWRLKFGPEVGRFARFPERRREMAHGVMGDPFVASAEKGERLFSVLLERLVSLCHEYHEVEPPKYREFGSHCP
jgi:creatinine amidohydrolase